MKDSRQEEAVEHSVQFCKPFVMLARSLILLSPSSIFLVEHIPCS
jgi:hypothetical protein